MRLRNIIILGLAITALSGCSTVRGWFSTPNVPVNEQMSSEQRQKQLGRIRSWNAQGAISVTFNNKTNMGSFNWHQRGKAYTFSTSGPLNLAGWQLMGHPGRVTLVKGGNQKIVARSPEALMQREMGWNIPLSNFRYWSRGMVAPGIEARGVKRDRFGHLTYLQQQGWQIRYLDYTSAAGKDLPRSMVFSNRRARIKMVVKNWQIGFS